MAAFLHWKVIFIREYENSDILQFALENDIIDLSHMQGIIMQKKRESILSRHIYKISEGSDGYWRTYLPDEEKGRKMVKKKTREDIEDAVIEYWTIEEENPTFNEVFEEWNDRRLELKKISPATHLRNKQVYNRHYKEFGAERIKSVAPEEIGEFLEEQIPKFNLASQAFCNLKSITRGMLKRAKKRKLINYNVDEILSDIDTSETDFKKVIKEDYEEVFSEDEMPIVLDYLVNHIDLMNMAILLMFVTGIRIGEVMALKHSDFQGNAFNIRRTATRYVDEDGKYVYTVKEFPKSQAGVRTVVIPEDYVWLGKMIQRQNPFSEYIFSKDDERITTHCVRRRLYRVCAHLNIYPKSPHKIRKTYGTILLDNHIDNRMVMGQMGHSDIKCTETYYHRNRRNLDKKIQIISTIPDFQRKVN